MAEIVAELIVAGPESRPPGFRTVPAVVAVAFFIEMAVYARNRYTLHIDRRGIVVVMDGP